jgi:hypothetical protein
MSVNFLKHAIKTRSTQHFAPMMAALAQLTSTPGEIRGAHSNYFESKDSVQGRLDSVESMIGALLMNFRASLSDYTTKENGAQATW